MKNTTALLSLTTALCACTGCNQHDDSAKLDALSQQLNQIQQNEVALSQRIDIISTKVDALPTVSQLNSEGYYYYTNELNALDNLSLKISLLSEDSNLSAQENGILFTNLARVEQQQLDDHAILMSINDNTYETWGMLTNGAFTDIGYTRLKIDDIGMQIATIEAKLGITY